MRGVVGVEFVAGELFGEKLVVGLVVVEGGDDVVAVAPGVRAVGVLTVSVGLGVADEVEPVAAPALAVGGAFEQAVDEALVGVGRLVVDGRRRPPPGWGAGR